MRSRVLLLLPLLGLLAVGGAFPAAAPVGAAACATAPPVATPATTATAFPLTVTDDAGREVVIPAVPERIASIAPSNTEILFALGLANKVVAVDDYSDYPPEAEQKPRLGSYVEPDLEQIVAAQPDLVLATGVHAETVLPELEALRQTVVVIDPGNLDEVLDGIGLVGRVTGEEAGATIVVCGLLERVDAVAARVADAPRPRVFFELSPELYTAGPGSFIDDLIARAGGENVAADAAEEWPQLSAEALLKKDPEVVLLADHGAGATPEQVRARPGWQQMSAVERDRLVPIDPDLTNRPGPRVVDGLEAIARALHPERFS